MFYRFDGSEQFLWAGDVTNCSGGFLLNSTAYSLVIIPTARLSAWELIQMSLSEADILPPEWTASHTLEAFPSPSALSNLISGCLLNLGFKFPLLNGYLAPDGFQLNLLAPCLNLKKYMLGMKGKKIKRAFCVVVPQRFWEVAFSVLSLHQDPVERITKQSVPLE